MKVVTAEEMQKIDKITINDTGIPGEVLMAYAGKSVADYILNNFKEIKRTAVFAGTGNNGGDGFVIAYLLFNKGIIVDVFIAGSIEKISGSSGIFLNLCKNNNVNIAVLDELKLKSIDIKSYDLVIDALLGTGFSGSPRGIIKDAIIKINKASVKVISVDLPSGLPSDGAAPEGEAIKADYTVTIGLPKISLVTYPGIRYTGVLHVSDIGFPVSLAESAELKTDLLNIEYLKTRLTYERDADNHKGSAGHLLLVGGFDNMEGAAIMTAMAAFETGVGLATLITTQKARKIIAGKIPELITRTLESFKGGIEKEIKKDIEAFFSEDSHYNVMIIGPGMGRSEVSSLVFNIVINNLKMSGIKRILIDGDGLYHLSEFLKSNKLPENISFIITPHFSEASRVLSKTVEQIKNNRLEAAKELANKTFAVALLKGPATIITDGINSLINTTGNPALGTGGSGDVLSGIIGALLLKDFSPLDSTGIGAYIHGLAADICIEESNLQVLKATDLVKQIRPAIIKIIN